MIPEDLQAEVERLREMGWDTSASKGSDGYFHVTIVGYSLPTGYNQSDTRLLLKLPASYPAGKPDMFWTDTTLRLANGQMPQAAGEENVTGTRWLRFSWHPKSWRPGADDLSTYLQFVDRRLVQVR